MVLRVPFVWIKTVVSCTQAAFPKFIHSLLSAISMAKNYNPNTNYDQLGVSDKFPASIQQSLIIFDQAALLKLKSRVHQQY